MIKYSLSHLTQDDDQNVFGPIQDDEALLLYGLIRTMRIHTILEVGGLNGYSSKNFLEALIDGLLITVDINETPVLADNHKVLIKNCNEITNKDISQKIDMIFFDCHDFNAQIELFSNLISFELIDDTTLIVLHDTNLQPYKTGADAKFLEEENAWCPISAERDMVNFFKQIGYDSISFHTKMHEKSIPLRHGITVMQKFKMLKT